MTAHHLWAMGPYGRRECVCGEEFEGTSAQIDLAAHIAAAPAGMGPREAIRLVAEHAIATAARDDDSIGWGQYPDIGERDWARICDLIDDLTPAPDADRYREAYAFLASRTEPGA